MKYSLLSILLLTAYYSNGQSSNTPQNSTDTIKQVLLDTLEVNVPAGKPPYQPAATKAWTITNTRLAISFNMAEKTASVKEWIKLHPYCYSTDTLLLDAKGVLIDSICLVTPKGNVAVPYTYANNELNLRFGQHYTATDSVQLYLKYTAQPYATATGGSAAIREDRGLYFINPDRVVPNKPVQIWTQGETESNSHWMITIDKPNTKFTTQIEMTVPDSMTTLSNGALIKQTKDNKGNRTDVWKMDKPIQAYAVMMAVGKYTVIKDKWNNKEVNYYVEPEYAPYARKMFANTTEMMEYFSKRTGVPYPWNKYSQIAVRDYVSGAMENTSASLFGEFVNQNFREIADKNSEDVVAHELFHQWFGDYVTCESWSNVTVNESFANYGEQLWKKYKHGQAAADELAYNDLQIYLYTSSMKDPQLVRYHYDSREEVFDGISYNKGGAILRYLNTLIGDAAFDKAMNIFLTRHALGNAEAHHWRMAVEEATGQDWNWFFNQWYYHAGHPELKVTYNYNDTTQTLGVSVLQTQEDSTMDYVLPLKMAVIYGNEQTVTDWTIDKRKDTLTYAYKNGVRPVLIPDYEHVLPGELKENKKAQQWLAQYKANDNYASRRLAIAGAFKQISDTNAQQLITLALNDKIKTTRLLALSGLSKVASDKHRKRWIAKVTDLAALDAESRVRAQAFEVLADWKNTTAKEVMIAAVTDSSYYVAGNALDALSKTDKEKSYELAINLLKTDPRSVLRAVIWQCIGNKAADADIQLYEQHVPYMQGNKKYTLAGSLSNYLKEVKSETSFDKGVTLMADMALQEDNAGRKKAVAGMMVQLTTGIKEDMADNKEHEAADKRRMSVIKAAMQRIIKEEKDKTLIEGYEKMLEKNFEEQK